MSKVGHVIRAIQVLRNAVRGGGFQISQKKNVTTVQGSML